MTWAKLHDEFFAHPKVLVAGPMAALLYVGGLCYANRFLTDGFLPETAVPVLVPGMRRPERQAQLLVKAGLWETAPGGFQVHDFLDWNDSAQRVRAKREAVKRRVDDWRVRHEGNGVRNALGNAVTNTVRNAAPTPTPTPTPTRNQRQPPPPPPASTEAGAGGDCRDGDDPVDNGKAETWRAAPWPSSAALAHLWNTSAPDELLIVESLSRRRIQKAEALLRQFSDREWWQDVFEQYRASKFLRGRTKRTPGHENFVADFDWLLSANKSGVENAVRVHDGAFLD